MLSEQLLRRLAPMRLQIHGYAHGGAGGVRRSRSKGSSAEFSDFRDYVPGDDLRRVDWNAYARLNRLYIREFMEEKDNLVSLILDTSASMREKWESVCQTALILACLALQSGDRVRIFPLNQPSSPLFHTRNMLPDADLFLSGISPAGGGDIPDQLRHLQRLPRGLAFFITDALFPHGMDAALDYLKFMHQETVLIQIMTPEELHPTLEGPLKLIDSESGEAVSLTVDADCLELYQKSLDEFFLTLRDTCRKREVPCLCLDTGSLPEQTFLPMLAKAGLIS